MRDTGIVAFVVALGLAIAAAAMLAGEDQSVLVPPPDVVAETFVRDLAMDRYEIATQYLSDDLKRQVSATDLRSTFAPLRQRTGKPDQVITTVAMISGEHARVLARLEGRQSPATMFVDLHREHRKWKVAAWPLDVVAK